MLPRLQQALCWQGVAGFLSRFSGCFLGQGTLKDWNDPWNKRLPKDNVGKAFVAYPNETCVHFTCKDTADWASLKHVHYLQIVLCWRSIHPFVQKLGRTSRTICPCIARALTREVMRWPGDSNQLQISSRISPYLWRSSTWRCGPWRLKVEKEWMIFSIDIAKPAVFAFVFGKRWFEAYSA